VCDFGVGTPLYRPDFKSSKTLKAVVDQQFLKLENENIKACHYNNMAQKNDYLKVMEMKQKQIFRNSFGIVLDPNE